MVLIVLLIVSVPRGWFLLKGVWRSTPPQGFWPLGPPPLSPPSSSFLPSFRSPPADAAAASYYYLFRKARMSSMCINSTVISYSLSMILDSLAHSLSVNGPTFNVVEKFLRMNFWLTSLTCRAILLYQSMKAFKDSTFLLFFCTYQSNLHQTLNLFDNILPTEQGTNNGKIVNSVMR